MSQLLFSIEMVGELRRIVREFDRACEGTKLRVNVDKNEIIVVEIESMTFLMEVEQKVELWEDRSYFKCFVYISVKF